MKNFPFFLRKEQNFPGVLKKEQNFPGVLKKEQNFPGVLREKQNFPGILKEEPKFPNGILKDKSRFFWRSKGKTKLPWCSYGKQSEPALRMIGSWHTKSFHITDFFGREPLVSDSFHPGDKPLSEPMVASLPPHICVIQPQRVLTKGDIVLFGSIGWAPVQFESKHDFLET